MTKTSHTFQAFGTPRAENCFLPISILRRTAPRAKTCTFPFLIYIRRRGLQPKKKSTDREEDSHTNVILPHASLPPYFGPFPWRSGKNRPELRGKGNNNKTHQSSSEPSSSTVHNVIDQAAAFSSIFSRISFAWKGTRRMRIYKAKRGKKNGNMDVAAKMRNICLVELTSNFSKRLHKTESKIAE